MADMANPARYCLAHLDPFQDELSFDDKAPMTSHAPMPNVSKFRRSSTTTPFHSPPVSLLPPSLSNAHRPSCKAKQSSPQKPLRPSQPNRMTMVPLPRPAGKGPHTDSPQFKQPQLSNFHTVAQNNAADPNTYALDKENIYPPFPPAINLSIDNYYPPNQVGKQNISNDSAPHKTCKPVKRPSVDEPLIPAWDSFPPIIDDGTKPQSSYAQLIGMAILRSPHRRLTLSQIYKWISDNYSFYAPTDAGWQNSIRHNLSLHKSFIKIERPKDDPGKGNYWAIEPGNEHLFLKDKSARKSTLMTDPIPGILANVQTSSLPSPIQPIHVPEPTLPMPLPASETYYSALPPLPDSQATLSVQQEPSSDATIPIPDNNVGDEAIGTDQDGGEAHSSLYTPLPAKVRSSPPSHRPSRRNGTSPTDREPKPPRTHKRKFASMDDSGYLSSLESSAIRPHHQRAMLLTPEAGRPRIKRGRAEEEIARLRGSSPFSPSKARSSLPYPPISSSPVRQDRGLSKPLPLTPVVKVKPPVQPPPSASPETNLRNHRAAVNLLLQSPLRRVAGFMMEETAPSSPAFWLDETIYSIQDSTCGLTDFDVFQDFPDADDNAFGVGAVHTGSPVKRSLRQSAASQTSGAPVLSDITNSAMKRTITSTPFFKGLNQSPSQFLDTPSKFFEGLSPSNLLQETPSKAKRRRISPLKPPGNDWQGAMDAVHSAASNLPDDFSNGVDILQGFQKIGSSNENMPSLDRSLSMTF